MSNLEGNSLILQKGGYYGHFTQQCYIQKDMEL